MEKSNKILFLDNDSVICLSNNWGSRHKKAREYMIKTKTPEYDLSMLDETKRPVEIRFDNFDKKSIIVLNKILEETDAEIVVSSDWRLYANLEELGEYYISQGIIKKPIGVTKKLGEFDVPEDFPWSRQWDLEQTRCLEIHQWLKEHPEVTNWVAVDDLNMGKTGKYYSMNFEHEWGLENFVQTPYNNQGIKQSGVKDKIIKFLTEKTST
jgi:hypothetical protein